MNTSPRIRRLAAPLLLACTLALPALAAGAPLPGDNFEADDGNLAVNTVGNLDWNAAAPDVIVDLPSASDNSFTMGSQENNPIATWGTTIAPVNNKADIARVYTRSTFPFLDIGIVRNQQANGTVAYHVELNQSTAANANGLPVRTAGDMLVIYDFQGNNTMATLTLHRWVTSGTCVSGALPCWGVGTTLNATQAVGTNNQASVTDTVVNPSESLGAKTFDEMAINLKTALGLGENQCVDFGQIWLKTREGGAFGSALQDLVGPEPIHIGNCDVQIEKDVVEVDGQANVNPSSAPYGSTLGYRVRVSLGPNSANVPLNLLTVTDTTVSDASLTNAPLTPVTSAGTIVGDDGDNLLESGEKWLYALSALGAKVTQTASACADVVNSATVAVTGGDADPTNNTATRTTPVVCKPDLEIDKTAPASVNFGDTVTYGVTVRHSATSEPLAIPVQSVIDELGGAAGVGLTLASGDTNTNNKLDPGETWTYQGAGGPFTTTATSCADITNTVTLTAAGDTNPANNTDTVTTTVVCKPDLEIDKTAPASVNFGDTVTYGVTVRHSTTSEPLAIPVQSVIDELGGAAGVGLTLASGDTNTNNKLDPGETWTYQGAGGPFTTTATSCADITNTVTLTAAGDTNPANNTDTVTTTVDCKPDLEIDKVADVQSVDFGGTVTYTITVRHSATSEPLAIPVQSVIDEVNGAAGVALTLASGDTNTNTKLDPGETWTYQGADGPFTAIADACAPLVNTVTLTAAADTNPANNTDTVSTPVICTLDVAIAKKADKQAYTPGQTITYTVTVTNTGQSPIPFSQIQVSDPMLANLTPVAPPATLGSGQSVDFIGTRAVTVADCGVVPNTATVALFVDGQQVTETDPNNNSASVEVPVNCTMDIAITKSADKATYTPGETITYTVTVTNTGQLPIPFAAIQVSDPTLPGLTAVGTPPAVLAPGASQVYTGTRTVTATNCGPLPNTATVSLVGDLPAESQATNNSASVTVNVGGAACEPVVIGDPDTTLRIVKVGPSRSPVKKAVRYAITVRNTGTVTARNVVLLDPIPAGLSLAKLPANATLVKGKLRWTIGDLAPGQSIKVFVLLRADANATRTRCNIATASATNAPGVRAKACTRFVRIAGAVRIPEVTG